MLILGPKATSGNDEMAGPSQDMGSPLRKTSEECVYSTKVTPRGEARWPPKERNAHRQNYIFHPPQKPFERESLTMGSLAQEVAGGGAPRPPCTAL